MKIFFVTIFTFFFVFSFSQQPVTPQKDGATGNYYFNLGNIYFEVNPSHGARITSFAANGTEYLHVSNEVADMNGSTAWLSPQSLWNWPPQTQIDSNPYSGGVKGDKLILTSTTATASNGTLKFQMRKKFSADLQDSSVTIVYTIINKSSTTKSFAAWEIMRVPTGGLAMFPVNGSITGDLAPFFKVVDGVAWWDYDSLQVNKNKAFADGKDGWMAHIDNNRLINIKKFPDAASNFPANGEKEIEYYANTDMIYNEFEKHSSYASVPANDSVSLSMTWYLRVLPENIDIRVGNVDILNYIDRIVNPLPNGVNGQTLKPKDCKIFPNPTSGDIQVTGLANNEKISFQLLNILGETVMSRYFFPGDIIDLHSLENGIYLYKLRTDGSSFSGKLILRK